MTRQLDMRLHPALAHNARIDRDQPVRFRFDGRDFSGFAGDTLASALLAHGVHLTGRSFKYHRPRGIMAAGVEDPSALVRAGEGARVEPNLRATQLALYDGLTAESQNRFPSLKFDLGAVNSLLGRFFPAGFYYKTFMWPASFWMLYEHFIRRAAGLGRAADNHDDPDRYEHTHAHCDILVVGGGPAGLQAALEAAKTGARVILADEQEELGGWLLSAPEISIDDKSAADWVASMLAELANYPEVTILPRSTVFGYMDHNYLTIAERVSDHLAERPDWLVRQRLWKLRAGQVILATGAHERPLVFGNNDLPGVMLSSSVRSYLHRYGVLAGRRAVIVTNNDDALLTALALHKAGCFVRAVADLRPAASGALVRAVRAAGIAYLPGHGVTAAKGGLHIAQAELAQLDSEGAMVPGSQQLVDCDLLAVSGGWTPAVHLHSQAGGKLSWDQRSSCFRPAKKSGQAISVSAANGQFDLARGLKEAALAARQAADQLGLKTADPQIAAVSQPAQNWQVHPVWQIPDGLPAGQGPKAFVDFQNDVTAEDIRLAAREGYQSVEHVKRYTTTGMATDQGKTSNINVLGILSDTMGRELASIGTTTFRMPYSPTSIGMIAGRDIKRLFDPVRATRMDDWHKKAGAKFEHVGQWMRAWYYPQPGESMEQAVNREVLAARQTAGLLDASTLGKIEVRGPDAAEFLDRVYTNKFSNLGIGRCRYGLMLKEDGMVMDDGVTTRLASDHFHMTTTTGGAARVLDWLEEFSQTEWPELKVWFTSVTEQWAVATLSGPKAREILAAAGCDMDLSDEALPFMSMQEGHVSGLPARLFRISFTGELSYEINVPARYGLALWTQLMAAGTPYGITPYGTEAMHVLRAEKGFIIVGQETDGTVTPLDLGMGWIVSKKKADFIGKRALARTSMADPTRKQLVGLKSLDGRVIPEGAHAVFNPHQPAPMDMLGQVTSSYFSPNLNAPIAMALLKGGHQMMGQRVFLPMLDGQPPIEAEITGTVFFDPKGERRDG